MILNCPLLFSNLNRYVLLQGSQIDVDKAFHNITLTLACLNDNRMDRDPGMGNNSSDVSEGQCHITKSRCMIRQCLSQQQWMFLKVCRDWQKGRVIVVILRLLRQNTTTDAGWCGQTANVLAMSNFVVQCIWYQENIAVFIAAIW